jgi:hypothetical protein
MDIAALEIDLRQPVNTHSFSGEPVSKPAEPEPEKPDFSIKLDALSDAEWFELKALYSERDNDPRLFSSAKNDRLRELELRAKIDPKKPDAEVAIPADPVAQKEFYAKKALEILLSVGIDLGPVSLDEVGDRIKANATAHSHLKGVNSSLFARVCENPDRLDVAAQREMDLVAQCKKTWWDLSSEMRDRITALEPKFAELAVGSFQEQQRRAFDYTLNRSRTEKQLGEQFERLYIRPIYRYAVPSVAENNRYSQALREYNEAKSRYIKSGLAQLGLLAKV